MRTEAVRLLLTGHTGYLGSRVAYALDAMGHSWTGLNGRLGDLQPRSIEFDAVIHCAGALRNRPAELSSANTEGTRKLIESLRSPARIIFVSSRSVYPLKGHRLVDESEEVAPFDDYGRSKLEAETLLRSSPHRVAILRSSGIFGHPTRTGIFLDKALDLALAGQPITLATPDRLEDYVPVDWLADALIKAALAGSADGQTLNLGGPPRSLASILGALDQAVRLSGRPGCSIQPKDLPVPDYPMLDSTQAISALGLPAYPDDRAVFAAMIHARSGKVA